MDDSVTVDQPCQDHRWEHPGDGSMWRCAVCGVVAFQSPTTLEAPVRRRVVDGDITIEGPET